MKSVQSHIHLFDNSTTPTITNDEYDTTIYSVTMPGIDEKPVVALSRKRGLTGKLLTTRLLDGSGKVRKFRDITFTLTCSVDEKDRLMSLAGVLCYYVPTLHEENVSDIKHETGGTQQGYPVVLSIDRVQHLDPYQQYWIVGLSLMEDSL